jgi:signal peptide peptidase SppA
MAETQIAAIKSAGPATRKATAVLPVYGMIDQHGGYMMDLFGGCSLDYLSDAFDMCMNEDRINNILLDIHSPGGSVYGVKEMADKIYAARGTKPICAIANSMMASAAYYIGSACDRVYATPGADVGSVGVYQMHFDQSKMMDDMGIKVTIARTPEFKAEGNPFEPLPGNALDEMKSDVERIYKQFIGDVAKYRGMDIKTVDETFGKGRTVDAAKAAKAGMVNRVATFDDVKARMTAGTIRPGSPASAEEWDLPILAESMKRRANLSAVAMKAE